MTLKFYPALLLLFVSVLWAGVTTAQTNIALGRPTASSSNENGSYLPVNVADGNYTTRWASGYADNQWISLDLGQQYDFTEVKLFWETALGRDYNIEVSDDGVNWTVAASVTGNTNLNNTVGITGFSGRYVRMFGLVRGTQWGFSLWEFEVYGTPAISVPVVNLAYLKPGTSSSNENNSLIPSGAFDGLGTNIINGKAHDGNNVEYPRWSSNYPTSDDPLPGSEDPDDQWIAVDLGAVYEIAEVQLYWEVANGKDFNIEVSEDGINWTVAATVTNNPSTQYINQIAFIPPVSGQYVRMHGIARNTPYGYSLYEFQVYGPNAILPVVLTDFRVAKRDGSVQLAWNASMDAETRFNIQRSSNGADFTTIGTLHFPTGTNGISNDYSFTDESPLAGLNYYRLEYTETGEKTLYSDIKTVRFDYAGSFRIAPNPVTGNTLRVELDKGVQGRMMTLRLLTITGQVVQQQDVSSGSRTVQMDLNRAISSGTYILQLVEGNQHIRSRKIILSK